MLLFSIKSSGLVKVFSAGTGTMAFVCDAWRNMTRLFSRKDEDDDDDDDDGLSRWGWR